MSNGSLPLRTKHIGVLDALDIATRLDELRTLKDGWLEGNGKSPPAAGLDWLANAFERWYPEHLVPPHLYPTAEGGVQAEWTLKPFEVSLDIDLKAHTAYWHSLDLQTGGDQTAELDLNNDSSWSWVADQVKQMAGGGV